MKYIDQIDLQDKRVFLRADLNVPLDDQGRIVDDSRIIAALPSLNYILENGGRVILASHLGRPKGTRNSKMSLYPVAERLAELTGKEVLLTEDSVGDSVKKLNAEFNANQILLLENLRFHPEETKNDEVFSEKLAALADVYINDAFGTLHRAHASTSGIVKKVPEAAAGFLVKKELEYLEKLVKNPQRPFIAILGGAKVSDKLAVIDNLLNLVDALIIGGAMAYTFLKAKGIEIGKSLLEEDKLRTVRRVLERAENKGIKIYLPCDHQVASDFDAHDAQLIHSVEIPKDKMALDIGPASVEKFAEVLREAKTIVWNGPLGVFEKSPFDQGTFAIAKVLSEIDALTVAGGGDSVSAIKQSGLSEKFSHLSTGGGATLEFLEGKILPGIKALEEADRS